MPGGGLPGHGLRGTAEAGREPPRRKVRQQQRRWPRDLRACLLLGPLRQRPRGHGRWQGHWAVDRQQGRDAAGGARRMTLRFFKRSAFAPTGGGTVRLFISKDAAAVAVGADEVVAAVSRAVGGATTSITRTGSRGMLWLEPLLELEVDGVRYGLGPLAAEDVPGVVA